MHKKKNYRYDIAILRLLCIIVVVFFHAYGMTYATAHLPEDIASVYRDKYEIFNQSYLINIAMPLFTVISGFLFGGQLMHGKYHSLPDLALNKFKRLMIPFFVFSTIFMFATNNVSLEPFYRWSYWHLWYIPMLFWCFVMSYMLRKIIFLNGGGIALLIVLFILPLNEYTSTTLVLGLRFTWLCWFVLGILLYRYESKIFDMVKKYHIIWLLVVLYFCTGVYVYTEYGENTVCGQISSLSAVIALWYVFRLVPWEKLKMTEYLLLLSSCSFGIYIFHNWVEVYMISSTAQRLLPLAVWAKAHIYLFPFVFSCLAFMFSFVLTLLLKKTQIGRALIS